MTAHELARELLAGPDLMVTVRGYEDEVNEIISIYTPTKIKPYPNPEPYYGDFTYTESEEDLPRAIHLYGESKAWRDM